MFSKIFLRNQILMYVLERNARSLPGVINHYAKAKIMHNVKMFIVHFLKVSWETPHENYGVKIYLSLKRHLTPSNLRNVIFMCAKYFHGEMALQRNVLFLGLPVYNSADYVWDHIVEGKACIKNPKTCGPSKWPPLSNGMSYSWVRSVSIEKPCDKRLPYKLVDR